MSHIYTKYGMVDNETASILTTLGDHVFGELLINYPDKTPEEIRVLTFEMIACIIARLGEYSLTQSVKIQRAERIEWK